MDREFTKHELDVQNFDAMREEEFLRAWDYIYAAITDAMDRAREEFEHEDMTPYIPEVCPGTLDALGKLTVRPPLTEGEKERMAKDELYFKVKENVEIDERMEDE